MILLDSDQILAAVGRSLERHVLPALDDAFARIQVQAALSAIEEVRHRLGHGDPYVEVNRRLRDALARLADDVRASSPEASARLDAARAELDVGDEPREQHRRLAEALTLLLAEDDLAAGRLRALLQDEAMRTAAEDGAWICTAAIESLQ